MVAHFVAYSLYVDIGLRYIYPVSLYLGYLIVWGGFEYVHSQPQVCEMILISCPMAAHGAFGKKVCI